MSHACSGGLTRIVDRRSTSIPERTGRSRPHISWPVNRSAPAEGRPASLRVRRLDSGIVPPRRRSCASWRLHVRMDLLAGRKGVRGEESGRKLVCSCGCVICGPPVHAAPRPRNAPHPATLGYRLAASNSNGQRNHLAIEESRSRRYPVGVRAQVEFAPGRPCEFSTKRVFRGSCICAGTIPSRISRVDFLWAGGCSIGRAGWPPRLRQDDAG